MTPGYFDTGASRSRTSRDNFDKIRDEDGYIVPGSLNDELSIAFKALA